MKFSAVTNMLVLLSIAALIAAGTFYAYSLEQYNHALRLKEIEKGRYGLILTPQDDSQIRVDEVVLGSITAIEKVGDLTQQLTNPDSGIPTPITPDPNSVGINITIKNNEKEAKYFISLLGSLRPEVLVRNCKASNCEVYQDINTLPEFAFAINNSNQSFNFDGFRTYLLNKEILLLRENYYTKSSDWPVYTNSRIFITTNEK